MSCAAASPKPLQTNSTDQIIDNPTESSLLIWNSELCTVQIENVLYEGPNPDYFYIKVEIINTSVNTIGVDLSDKWKIIYPNQWGNLYTPERFVINEMRIPPDELDSLRAVRLVTDFEKGKLEFIEPAKSFTYYTEFNANGRAAIDETSEVGDFFYLSLDGQLFLTDGNKCERISFEDDVHWFGNSVLTKPLVWDEIVNEELIIDRD